MTQFPNTKLSSRLTTSVCLLAICALQAGSMDAPETDTTARALAEMNRLMEARTYNAMVAVARNWRFETPREVQNQIIKLALRSLTSYRKLEALQGEPQVIIGNEIPRTKDNKASEAPDQYLAKVKAEAGSVEAEQEVEFQPPDIELEINPAEILLGEEFGLLAKVTWNGQPVAEHTLKWTFRILDNDDNEVYAFDGTGTPPAQYGKFVETAAVTNALGIGVAVFQTGTFEGTIEVCVEDESVELMATAKKT